MAFFIFGAGSIAQIASQYFSDDFDTDADAFIVDDGFVPEPSKAESMNLPAPIISLSDFQSEVSPQPSVSVFVAVSYSNQNGLRVKRCEELLSSGYQLASYVSPRASVLTKEPIGLNAFILEDNTIQPFVKIGNFVTLWSGNHLGHHSSIEDGVFVSSHVVISGNCRIGERSFLGVNATVGDSVKIGNEVILGAGSTVTKDVEDFSVIVPPRSTQLSKSSRDVAL